MCASRMRIVGDGTLKVNIMMKEKTIRKSSHS